jgi:soluble lytic murein transglycosylase-like protein
MTLGTRLLATLLCLGLVGPGAAARDLPEAPAIRLAAVSPPLPRPAGAAAERCTADGVHCIRLARYIPDVCRVIEAVARTHALDAGFFARLLWKESLFDAAAVSPAGAQGIAQFMPGTAELRGLTDAFNPAEAMSASAAYLAELSRDYGNIGLAAAAYNAGEAGLERFLAAKSGLPAETRAYVRAITGVPVEAWRDAPPDTIDLSLDREAAFQAACETYAADRTGRAFRSTPPLAPWGVVVASNRNSAGAERQVARLQNRFAPVLAGEPVAYTRGRRAGMNRALLFAQVGRPSRAEAEALCARLRAAGGDCMVLKN